MAPRRVAVLLAVAAVVAVALLAAAPCAESALTCGQVYTSLTPCMPYIRSGGTPSKECCSGIRGLQASAITTADRQMACRCLKAAALSLSRQNLGVVAGLPDACGVRIPYKISTSTDCNKVS